MGLVFREFLKFGAIGAVAFVVDVGLFNAMLHAGEAPVLDGRPITAGILSAAVATVVAWLGNRYWTFRRRRRSEIHREAVLFFLMNIVGIGIAAGCLAISRYVLDFSSPLADNIAKNGFGLILGMAFRFTAYRYVVFRGDRETSPATTPVHPVHRVPAVSPVTAFTPHVAPGPLTD